MLRTKFMQKYARLIISRVKNGQSFALLPGALAAMIMGLASAQAGWARSMPDLEREQWPAAWITHPESPAHDYGVIFFRRELVMPWVPESFRVHVSADERYRLFVNGVEVASGPARGDRLNWRYETAELAPFLHPGTNVLAAQVWKMAEAAPWAQVSSRLGFILQVAEPGSQGANSGAEWKVLRTGACQPEPVSLERKDWIPAGYGEHLDGKQFPWGWERECFDDQDWAKARLIEPGCPRGMRDGITEMGWLVPRRIPPLEHKTVRIPRLARSSGVQSDGGFLMGNQPLTIPPHTQAELLLDQAHLTVGFPELVVSAGRDAEVRLTYAEALVDDGNKKGNRNELAGRKIIGLSDVFLPDGGEKRLFRPLGLRTWRYLQLNLRTGDAPLVIDDIRGVFTAYPFQENATFESSDPSLKAIWNTGWRTARLCAGETFFDCPYYEQLQYIGDTRVEALITLMVSGDDRLMRNAIQDFHDSGVADGLTASRYPSRQLQLIPPYSLFWIAMLHDHWMHRGDAAFLRPMLGNVDSILRWYELRLAKDAIFGPMEWWNFTDWCQGWSNGEPPGAARGGSAIIALQFVYNAQRAAELFDAMGEPDRAAHWREVAGQVKNAVSRLCWDDTRGLFADTPSRQTFSQHANILAVLTGTGELSRSAAIMEKVLDDATLTQCTLYFRFYLHRALQQAGLGDRYGAQLKPWRDMLAIGLTTFAETPEPTRSDCHAWSASPNYDFLELICGVQPASSGFKTVRIEPALGQLQWATARVPHPAGMIEVRLERRGVDGISADITLPPGLTGEFIWHGGASPLQTGKQHLER